MGRIYPTTPPLLSLSSLFLLLILAQTQAWNYSKTNINLSSPPPLFSVLTVENDQKLPDYPASTAWPCDNIQVPAGVIRTPWPINGGRLTYNLTNATVGSLKDSKYLLDSYLGQVDLGNGTYSIASQTPGNNGYALAETVELWDFQTELDCSALLDVRGMVGEILGEDGDVPDNKLEGLNATFGLRIVLFTPNPDGTYPDMADYTMEEMSQCAYVTFTTADVSDSPDSGYCNGYREQQSPSPVIPIPVPSPTFVHPTLYTTTTPTPSNQPIPPGTGIIPTASPALYITTSKPHSHTAIAAGVGVSMSVSIAFLALAFLFLRRRKAKSVGTVGADVIVSRPLGRDEKKGTEKGLGGQGQGQEKKKNERSSSEEEVESSSNSVHSEPLPAYTV